MTYKDNGIHTKTMTEKDNNTLKTSTDKDNDNKKTTPDKDNDR